MTQGMSLGHCRRELGYGVQGLRRLLAGAGAEREAMFATAVQWARKAGPRPVKLANLGEQVENASQTLYKILEQHGPLTVRDCWQHASQMENAGLKSKRHMKMMLRWMRERRTIKIVCQHGGALGNPTEKEFLFSIVPPKVPREQSIKGQQDSTPAE